MTYILGLSYNYHDAAAALLKDGAIIAASTEERHTRQKHDPGFPAQAIALCLEQADIGSSDLDWVVYHEQPLVKFDRILKFALRSWWRGGRRRLQESTEMWASQGKFDVREQIAHALKLPPERVHFCEHHLSHAASAYFCSPFESATIVTLDGVGEWETCTISQGEGNTITKIQSVYLPNSIGLFYSALTAFLGFEINDGEYKVMGMAGFGRPTYADRMLEWFTLRADGSFRLRQDLFNFETDAKVPYLSALLELLGPPREPNSPFCVRLQDEDRPGTASRYANVAASVQAVTELVTEHVIRRAVERTSAKALCLAGGVALNSAANHRLRQHLALPMFIQPAAGDAGCALGAAKWLHHEVLRADDRELMTTVALGAEYSDEEIVAEVRRSYGPSGWIEYPDMQALCAEVVDLLAAGKVVGWFQGRAEWGPRALGQRSILANPCLPEMQAVVNEKIKFREPFRPFAPAVLVDRARDFFEIVDIEGEHQETNPYNFMLALSSTRPEMKHRIPAVTHVDGTARVQIVRREVNPLFYRLIEAFSARTNVPILLNTSFNLRGEPIVNSPSDAIKTFEWSGMDALAMGRTLIIKDGSTP